MKSSLKTISIFLLIFLNIQSTSQFELFGLKLDQLMSLSSQLFNPMGFFAQLAKIKLESTNEDFTCTLCKNLVIAVRNTIEEKYTPDEITNLLTLICSINKDYDYCKNFHGSYTTSLLKNGFLRLMNEQNFCFTLTFCPEAEEVEDTYDYAQRLLKDKPNKSKEKIDPTAQQLKMLQVTDIHYDAFYQENATVFCSYPLCCEEEASTYARIKSGKFGYMDCDTSLNLLKSFVEKAYELKPDFIIWNGDNAEHNNWNSSQQNVYDATSAIKNAIDEVFQGSVKIFPVIGNHENYPNDLWDLDNTIIFEKLADVYKDYFFEDEAYETFKTYGYYTELLPSTNLRIVVLNCIYCSSVNYNALASAHTEAKKEFIWLEAVLRKAESNNEYVYIVDHFGINSSYMLYECSKRLRALFDRFDYIIRGYFSGHEHVDYFSAVRAYFEPRPIININYVAPSLTTNGNVNPSFRQYIIDSNTKNIIDYEQYRLNITDANVNGVANWTLSHKATELFNVSDLTEMDKMCSIDVEGDFIIKKYADADQGYKKAHNKKEIKYSKCAIQTDSFHDFYLCSEKSMFTEDYGHELVNLISGEWPVDAE